MAEKKLTFRFVGKFQGLLAGVEKAKSALKSLDGIVRSIGDKFSFDSAKEMVSDFSDFADKINEVSKKTGESVEEIQKWNNAINAAGGDAEGFNNVLTNLADELNMPWQDGNLTGMFSKFGVLARDASGNMKKPIEMITELSDKLKGFDSGTVQTFGEKFGFDQKTIDLLKDGQGQLAQYLEKGKKMGVFSKEEIRNGAELRKTFSAIKASATLLSLQIGSSLTPVAKTLAEAFQAISGWFKENERVVKAAAIVGAFYAIIKAIKAFDVAAKISALTNPYVLLFAAITAGLALLVEDFLAFKEGADSLLPWDEMIEGTKNFVSGLVTIVGTIVDVLLSFIAPVKDAVAAFVEFLINVFSGKGILESLSEFADQVEQSFDKMAGYILQAFGGAFDAVAAMFEKLTGKLGSAWKTFKGWFGFGDDEDVKVEGKNALSGSGIEEKIPHVPDVASVQNSSSSVINNANRSMTVQKLEIKTDKVDSASLAGIAEKAAGFDTFQANYGGV